jgi:lysophospholipase L1-like esterase
MTIKPCTIVCLGDSITCNWDGPSYVDYWQELLDKQYGSGKIKVISAGVNGETAQDGYYRLNSDVIAHQPDLVIVMFGHNDLRYGLSPLLFHKYLAKITNRLTHDLKCAVWLLTPNQVIGSAQQALYSPYLKTIRAVAAEKSITLFDIWSQAFKNQDLTKIYTYTFDYEGLTGLDYIHPNETGHRLIAQYLMDQFTHRISV